MTIDNLRARRMVKPLECVMCKKFESVKHLMFEWIVSRLLWDDVFEIFDMRVTDFETDASKWLYNQKNHVFQSSFIYCSLGVVDQ
jgi:hypothetical protein